MFVPPSPVRAGDVIEALFFRPVLIAGVRTALVEAVLPPLPGEDWPTLLVAVEYGQRSLIETAVSEGLVIV